MNFQPLKDFLDYYLPMMGVPGSDTVIYKNHEEIFRYRSGFDSMRFRTPVRADALYNIYSCSKVATGVAAAQLIERGELLITDPLYAYIPEFRDVEVKVRDDEGNVIGTRRPERPILIRDLLSMTSGMNYDCFSKSIKQVISDTDGRAPTVELCRALANEPLEFDPGADYQYSLSLDVMGAVVELISGQRFKDYMQDNIFAPLGMKDTSYHYDPEKMDRLATQYVYDDENHVAKEIPKDECVYRFGTEYDSAGAGIISTVDDYVLLADALANDGVGKTGERILSPAGIRLMSTNMLNEKQLKTFRVNFNAGYGYGFGVRMNMVPESSGNLSSVGQFGWDGAKLSVLTADPKTRVAVFHAEHMGGLHRIVIPRLRNIIAACTSE